MGEEGDHEQQQGQQQQDHTQEQIQEYYSVGEKNQRKEIGNHDEKLLFVSNTTTPCKVGTGTGSSYDHDSSINSKIKQNYFIPGLQSRKRSWIYERNFTLVDIIDYRHQQRTRESDYVLVVEGIKMGASIEINGFHIGNVTNQFRRYIFPIPLNVWNIDDDNDVEQKYHQQQSISVSFLPDIDTRGRFMACSGGWDWAPYTQNAEASCIQSRRVFTFGIIQPIYIVKIVNDHSHDPEDSENDYYNPAIVHVVPKIHYLGDTNNNMNTINNIDNDEESTKFEYGSNSNKSRMDSVIHGIHDKDQNGNFKLVVDVHLMVGTNDADNNNDDYRNQRQTTNNIRRNAKKTQRTKLGEVIFRAPFFKNDKVVSINTDENDNIKDNNNSHEKMTTSRISSSEENIIVVTLSTVVERKDVRLWWPRGTGGEPNLYSLQVAYRNRVRGTATDWVEHQIGMSRSQQFHKYTFYLFSLSVNLPSHLLLMILKGFGQSD